MMDSNGNEYDSKSGKESGNIFCKSITLLCLGVFLIWILLTLYNFLIFMTHLPLPALDLFDTIIFTLGFVVGWGVREVTKH
ncbi:MAG: hypothetical protein ACFFCT_10420 [Candidatus Odinarchaeota archaeon]